MPNIADAKILIIATDGFEESELFEPRQTLLDRGASVTLASLETKEIQGEKGDQPGRKIKPDLLMEEVDSQDYDALLLPGGTRNPDRLRMEELVVYTVKKFADEAKTRAEALTTDFNAKAKEAFGAMREAKKKEMLAKFDTNRNGTLEDAEKTAMHDARIAEKFAELDTNKDGKIDGLDDPYSPWWPGPEYVDW